MPANYLPKKKKKTKKMRNHVSYNWAVLLSKEKKKMRSRLACTSLLLSSYPKTCLMMGLSTNMDRYICGDGEIARKNHNPY